MLDKLLEAGSSPCDFRSSLQRTGLSSGFRLPAIRPKKTGNLQTVYKLVLLSFMIESLHILLLFM